MKATDRHKARVAAMVSEPMEGEDRLDITDGAEDITFHGEASDTVRQVTPAATGILTELIANKLKSNEEADKKKKYESSEGFQARKAADEAEKRASFAEADATVEEDPNGPKHRAAAELRKQANAARIKANYYAQQEYAAAAAAGQAGAMQPQGMPGQYPVPAGYGMSASNIFTTKNMLIAGGALLGIGLIIAIARR